jgi:hypothetical protein
MYMYIGRYIDMGNGKSMINNGYVNAETKDFCHTLDCCVLVHTCKMNIHTQKYVI